MDQEAEPDWAAYRRAVGDRLRETRLRRNYTQERLSHDSGVSLTALRAIEAGGTASPRLRALWRVARVLHVSVHDLLKDDPTEG